MDYLTTNKIAWDARTRVHLTSDFYDVEGFLSGKTSLTEIELNELRWRAKVYCICNVILV